MKLHCSELRNELEVKMVRVCDGNLVWEQEVRAVIKGNERKELKSQYT